MVATLTLTEIISRMFSERDLSLLQLLLCGTSKNIYENVETARCVELEMITTYRMMIQHAAFSLQNLQVNGRLSK